MSESRNPIRLAHLSDIHLTAHPLGWRRFDWFNKRLTTWFNLRCLGRAAHFRHAEKIVTAFAAEIRDDPPDRVIFSGDATALGFDSEVVHAATALGVESVARAASFGVQGSPKLAALATGGIAVPGNHDYCTRDAEVSGSFERHFAAWQVGERVDDAIYPFAQHVGHLWLVAVNSAVANRWSWDASGLVGDAQLRRLDALLQRLDSGPRILVTHYPVCLADGRPEGRWHGLRDLAETIAVAKKGGVGLWLHGHRHGFYYLERPPQAPFPVICAGSTTQSGRWRYGRYLVDGVHLHGTVRVFNPLSGSFRDEQSFDLQIGGS